MKALLLERGRVVDPSQDLDQVADLLLRDGKVAAVGDQAAAQAPAEVQRIDVSGLVVCPGLIDLHVHLREPGESAKETIETGTRAAARGGFTSVVCMPNTSPTIDNPSAVAWMHERCAQKAKVNVLVAGAITKGIDGKELAPIGSLRQAGVVAITDDGHCVQSNEVMRRAVEYSTMFDLLVMDHCQEYLLVTDGVMHDGHYGLMLGLPGWPAEGEEMIVARNILLAQKTGARLHCQHISAAGSVELLRHARERGVPISGEACPHHFTLTDAALAGSEIFWREDGAAFRQLAGKDKAYPAWPAYDANFKMNPPVRSAEDREAILQGIADGVLEVIASDHAPHCNYEKDVEFDRAPFGITGLETELPLALMQLFHSGRMTLIDLLARFTTGPARLLNLPAKGSLAAGSDADVTVFDLDRDWSFEPGNTVSKSVNSPFYSWPLKGQAVWTIVNGNVAWPDRSARA
jgi:dihydroorotase